MIISEKVTVKNSIYYKELGYISDSRYIEINIVDMPKGSHFKIVAKCDYCNNEREISYRDYNKNISINNKYSCSIKCGNLKSKETNLNKYGVESVTQTDSFKEKSKKTIMRKYGVDHISKVESISESKSNKMLERREETSKRVKEYWDSIDESEINTINERRCSTNLEKYGVKYVSQVDEIKGKIRETNLEKHGGYTYQSETLSNKVIKTNLERYGFINPSSSDLIKNKVRKTNLERYGEHPSKTDIVKRKQISTIREKWGSDNIMLSEEFRTKFNISNDHNYIKYIGNRDYEFWCDVCNNSFIIDYDNYYQRSFRNVNRCTNCFPISDNSSIKEIELRNFISERYVGEIISNYRDGLEIDIYLPDLKLGFEFNGLYWHSSYKLDNLYHRRKLDYFKEHGIRILIIWEDDWDHKREIIKSQINNWIDSLTEKIWARKCVIKKIDDKKMVRDFLESNHIQGYIRSSVKIGLFFENRLVSLMTFDKSEGRKKMVGGGWNLSRFCSEKNTSVIGGASKLLKYFINNYDPNRIISFADMDWSTGDLYYKLGFNLINTSNPDYKYIVNGRRINKQRFTKKKLSKLGYDMSRTENDITSDMGLSKIYNCGQLKFELLLKNYYNINKQE